MGKKNSLGRAMAAVGLAWGVAAGAQAQAPAAFPSKPVTIVVPFPPGSSLDALTRVLGSRLSEIWKQPVVVDNRAGGSGLIGTEQVTRAPADGHTLLHSIAGTIVASHLRDKPLVRPDQDLTPITLSAVTGLIMAAGPGVKAGSPAELADLVRASPGAYSYGSYGTGSVGHLYGYIFNKQLGLDMLHVAYRGEAQAVNDVIGGQLPLLMLTPGGAAAHIATGKIHAIAVTGARRSPILPDVPTFAELGYKGMDDYGWYGFFGPPGMPAEVSAKISADIAQVLAEPQIQAQFDPVGLELVSNTPETFARLVASDSEKWRKVVQETGIRLD